MTAKANMTWLTDDLATGGDLSYDITKAHAQAQDIIEQGVTHIIDLRVESSDFDTWDGTEIQYHWLPTNDAVGHHLPQELFDAAVQIDRVARATGGKVLAHCHMGINRGPSVAFALLLDRGMDPIKAFDLIRRLRPQAGIYYAMDALIAHRNRGVRAGVLPAFDKSQQDRLHEHIRRTMNRDALLHVKRAIRQGHENDHRERTRR
jgi:dual specificity phosphatase 3